MDYEVIKENRLLTFFSALCKLEQIYESLIIGLVLQREGTIQLFKI